LDSDDSLEDIDISVQSDSDAYDDTYNITDTNITQWTDNTYC